MIRDTVTPTLQLIAGTEANEALLQRARSRGHFDVDEYRLIAAVLAASQPLPLWRRKLIARRCCRVAGDRIQR